MDSRGAPEGFAAAIRTTRPLIAATGDSALFP
jgi:hypothetical protein